MIELRNKQYELELVRLNEQLINLCQYVLSELSRIHTRLDSAARIVSDLEHTGS